MRLSIKGLASLVAALAVGVAAHAQIPVYRAQVVRVFPHDPGAFTEGLFYLGGRLYEGTGDPEPSEHRSSIREVDLASGKVLRSRAVPEPYFGEGIVAWRGRLIELTWVSHTGFIYDLSTFKPIGRFHYAGEGWGLTTDGRRLIMSDGTPVLRFLDPTTLKQVGSLKVTADGVPVKDLNELEWVRGEIYANIWLTGRIARIDPATGHVVGWIDLQGLTPRSAKDDPDAVANGIAYDAANDRLFVTGKLWPRLFEVNLVKETGAHGR